MSVSIDAFVVFLSQLIKAIHGVGAKGDKQMSEVYSVRKH